MAGTTDTAEGTVSVARSAERYEQPSSEPTADALRRDFFWSMASTGLAFQRPSGEIPNGFSTPLEGELSQPHARPGGIPTANPITRFGLPSKIINEAISAPVEKPAEPADPSKGAEFSGATLQQLDLLPFLKEGDSG